MTSLNIINIYILHNYLIWLLSVTKSVTQQKNRCSVSFLVIYFPHFYFIFIYLQIFISSQKRKTNHTKTWFQKKSFHFGWVFFIFSRYESVICFCKCVLEERISLPYLLPLIQEIFGELRQMITLQGKNLPSREC